MLGAQLYDNRQGGLGAWRECVYQEVMEVLERA